MESIELKKGDIVQLNPETTKTPCFRGCLMIVSEPKPFGAQGYISIPELLQDDPPQAYYRATWEEMEFVGKAQWI